MNGALDRMVARTRGTLPVVLPLATPSFTALRGGFVPTVTEPGFDLPPLPSLDRSSEAEEASGNIPVRPRTPDSTVQAFQNDSALPERSRSREPMHRPPTRDKGWSSTIGSASIPPAGLHAHPLLLDDSRVALQPALGLPADPKGTNPPSDGSEGIRRVDRGSRERSANPTTPTRGRGADSRPQETPSHPEGADDALPSTVAERAEINISIGTIELRAAKSDPRPTVPAFKPRVSLEEFLRRRGTGR